MMLASMLPLLLLSADPRWQSAPPAPVPTVGCVDRLADDKMVEEALRGLTFKTADEARAITGVRLRGLGAIDEGALWAALGGKPDRLDGEGAAILVRKLVVLQVFAKVTPTIEIAGTEVILGIDLVEHPRVTRVVIEGAGEVKPKRLVEALFDAPSERAYERLTEALQKTERRSDKPAPRCPDPLPPVGWLARAEGETVHPGVVWKGLPAALERALEQLFDRGFEMAMLSAALAPDGTLTVRLDEGRVERVEVRGVAPEVEAEVRRRLSFPPGRPFVSGELEPALRNVKAALPFLEADRKKRLTRVRPRVLEEGTPEGGRRYRLDEVVDERARASGPPTIAMRVAGELGIPGELLQRFGRDTWYTVEKGTLVLHLRARRSESDVHAVELLRHTQVTSFAPGLEVTGRLWDPRNRAHVSLDLAGNIATNRPRAAGEDGAATGRRLGRFDFLAGPRVQLPALRIAEVGFHVYSQIDTFDRWRMQRVDSYLGSLVVNRPDATYFRRQGGAAFATAHLAERLTCGVEYRRDDYDALASLDDHFTVFNRDERPFPNVRSATPGRMGSLIFRVELASRAVAAHKVGTMRRTPETSIVAQDGEAWWSDFRTVNTVEIVDPALGGDQRFAFTRVVSDSTAFLRTGRRQGLKGRIRAAGRVAGHRLPAQKEEALGGWNALRGYGFEELGPGNFSLLATAEYRLSALSAFVDVGSVRAGTSWQRARTGIGGAINFGDDAHLDLAWRTDGEGEAFPEVRFMLARTF